MNNVQKSLTFFLKPSVFFFFVTVFITWPLWQTGYLFLFDWSVSSGSMHIWNHSIAHMIFIFLGNIIGYPLFPKIVCFLMIYTLGMAGWFLGKKILTITEGVGVYTKHIPLLTGLFLINNPFVYTRAVDGQWYVIMGMGAMTMMFAYLIAWYRNDDKKYILVSIAWGTATVLISQHAVFFVVSIVIVFCVAKMITNKSFYAMTWMAVLFVSIGFFNSNVIVGYMYDLSSNSMLLQSIDASQLSDFQSVDHGQASILVNLLSMHGYWGEREHRFTSTQEYLFIWKPLFFFLISMCVIGMWRRRGDKIAHILLVLIVLSIVGAIGSQGSFVMISEWMYEHMPYYEGLREPHKWLSVYVVIFIIFFTWGIECFCAIFTGIKKGVFLSLIILAIFLYTPTMINGFNYQMLPQNFPQEWHDVYDRIDCEEGLHNTLFLPEQQYIKVDFLDYKKITNPAFGFFDTCLLFESSSNIENMKEVILSNSSCNNIAILMQEFGAKYIVVSRSGGENIKNILEQKKCIQSMYEGMLIDLYELR